MARSKLAKNAKISEIIGTLDNPTEYVRGVFGNMTVFRRTHLEPVVRIGTTGRGIFPHYRFGPPNENLNSFSGFVEFAENNAAFNGRNHNQMEWGAHDLMGEHWSQGAMTNAEIRDLLGNLRGIGERGNS